MVHTHYDDPDFILQTQTLVAGDRFQVRSDSQIPNWIRELDKYKGIWVTVAKRNESGTDTFYQDLHTGYGAFYPTDIEQIAIKLPLLLTQSPNLPAV